MKNLLLATLLLSAPAVAQNCSLQSHGQPCGARMAAQVVHHGTQTGLRFGLHSRPNSLAVLAIGHPAPNPIPLPGGPCHLLVRPLATQLTTTNANGDAMFGFPLPHGRPFQILFQGVVVNVGQHGLVAASSNVIAARCQ